MCHSVMPCSCPGLLLLRIANFVLDGIRQQHARQANHTKDRPIQINPLKCGVAASNRECDIYSHRKRARFHRYVKMSINFLFGQVGIPEIWLKKRAAGAGIGKGAARWTICWKIQHEEEAR